MTEITQDNIVEAVALREHIKEKYTPTGTPRLLSNAYHTNRNGWSATRDLSKWDVKDIFRHMEFTEMVLVSNVRGAIVSIYEGLDFITNTVLGLPLERRVYDGEVGSLYGGKIRLVACRGIPERAANGYRVEAVVIGINHDGVRHLHVTSSEGCGAD